MTAQRPSRAKDKAAPAGATTGAAPDTTTAGAAAVVKLLSGEEILAAADYKFEDVEVPEWGGSVRIKSLTGSERDKFEASTIERRGKNVRQNLDNLRARLVAWSAIDAGGNRLFQPYQIEELGRKSAAALDRCFAVAQRLSKLSEEDVEELVENFDNGPSGSSTFD